MSLKMENSSSSGSGSGCVPLIMRTSARFFSEYNEKKKILTLNDNDFYYAENYKEGPSGKFTSEDDDDITITFKDGKATYDDDGDKETITYYCYKMNKDVYIVFYGEEVYDSEFYYEFGSLRATFDDDEVVIAGKTFEK